MSLRKKFAQNIVPVVLAAGGAIGVSIGYQVLDHDWDDQRASDADQIVTEFENALDELSVLKQENIQLDKNRKSSLLKWEAVSDSKQQYQKNLDEVSQRSTEYAKLMLSTPEIGERDFEALAMKFNDIGLSPYSDIKVNSADADGLKECQLKYYGPNENSSMHSNISDCMNDEEKFGTAPLGGLMGIMFSVLIITFPRESNTLRRWRALPDKPKNPKSGQGMVARLTRRIRTPKRPQN